MKNKNTIAGILILIFTAVIIYALIIILKPNKVELQGVAESTQIKVASKLIGRVDTLAIRKGDDVKKGDLLFVINSPEIDAKMNQAMAARQAAKAQEMKAENGARQEDIKAAYNTYLKAKAAADFAKKTFERVNNLYKEGVVPEQKKDEIETKMITAIKTEEAAESIWQKAVYGARDEDKDAAVALVKRADAVIEEVEIYKDEICIKSPINGEVSNIIAEEGELVPNGYPVVTIVDLNDVWFSFNIKETYLDKFKKGTEFTAVVPGIGNKEIKLKVSFINPLGDFATWKATKTSGDFDIRTFEIHARPVDKVEGLRPGMSALTTI